ncbi:hypothetical protein GC169_04030 [bacterium]|nr:hypothetical protein [bacterium]
MRLHCAVAAFAVAGALALLGGCTIDLIDDAISNELQVSALGDDRYQIRAESFVPMNDVFKRADETCGVYASPVDRSERSDDPRYVYYVFRCERPPAFPPPRDNHPLPPVFRDNPPRQ